MIQLEEAARLAVSAVLAHVRAAIAIPLAHRALDGGRDVARIRAGGLRRARRVGGGVLLLVELEVQRVERAVEDQRMGSRPATEGAERSPGNVCDQARLVRKEGSGAVAA